MREEAEIKMCVQSAAFVMRRSPETRSESYSPLSLFLNWRTSYSVAVIILTNTAAVCSCKPTAWVCMHFLQTGILGNVGN